MIDIIFTFRMILNLAFIINNAPSKPLKLTCAMVQKKICFAMIFLVTFFIPAVVPAQVITGNFKFEGKMRDYVVFLPKDYDGVSNMPLVLNLHGTYTGFNGKWQMDWTLMNTVADTAGFIVVYPTGIFQDGTIGSWYYDVADPTNGIGFIDALIDTLNIRYRINNDQIYACGHSSGGFMSCKLASELNHRIAAIASEGGGITQGIAKKVNLKRPMPFLSIRGTADPLVPYNGETGIYSAEETVRFWTDLNICSNPDTISLPDKNPSDGCTVEKITYTKKGANTKVVFYKVINGGHTWPGSAYDIPSVGNTNRDIRASEEIWNFFKRYKLSQLSFPQHDITSWSSPLCSVPILAKNISPMVVVKNAGLNEEFDILVTCEIDSSGRVIYSDSQSIDSLKSFGTETVAFKDWRIYDSLNKYKLSYHSQLSGDENVFNDTLKALITATNLMDDFESGLWKWAPQDEWGVSTMFKHSGIYSFKLNPDGFYLNNSDSWVAFKYAFDFSQLQSAHLSYWTMYYTQKDHDFGFVEVSVDSGKTWHQVGDACTGTKFNWVEQSHSLTAYCGAGFNDVRIRFHFVSDSTIMQLGWFIDDVSIYPTETAVSNRKNIPLPEHFVLSNNYPNPFNSRTIITYQLPRANDVKLVVYNLRGQKIRTLIDQRHGAGSYQITWDGLDSQGSPVTSGIYFYELKTNDNVQVRKMALVK